MFNHRLHRSFLGVSLLALLTSSCSFDGAAGGANGAFPGRYVAAGVKQVGAAAPVVVRSVRALGQPGQRLRRKLVKLVLDRKPPARDGASLSLTASDGTGLELRSYKARAALQGPLALTELTLSFQNPKARVIEGRFEITLPPGASISRFAMRISGRWQEAEVVELQRARRVYEDFLHRKQDPALLEKKAGNRFRARVFPIPARGVKELRVTYSQQLSGAETAYRLPLAGLPKVRRADVKVFTAQRIYALALRDEKPAGDVLVHGSARVAGLVSGKLAVARARVKLARSAASINSLLVLFDSSASRAIGFARQLRSFGALIEALAKKHGANMPLTVACFDQVVRPIYRGRIAGFGAQQLAAMREHGALGASDLSRALRWAKKQKGRARLLVISDGVLTAGQRSGLGKLARSLQPATRRADALVVGGIRDDKALGTVVRGALAADGLLIDRDQPLDRLVARLSHATASGVEIAVQGASFVHPRRLDGVQDGDEVLVYAELDRAAAKRSAHQLTMTVGKQTSHIALAPVQPALLQRSFVRARIDVLQAQIATLSASEPYARQRLARRIVDLSTRNRVLSDYTALLVLETARDYRRFGLDRRALTNILRVTPRGPRLMRRSTSDPLARLIAARAKGKKREARRRAAETRRQRRLVSRLLKQNPSALRGNSGARSHHRARRVAPVTGSAHGRDARDALGALSGTKVGESYGLGGLGGVGTGRGGGGTGAGRIGLGSGGTIGRGAGSSAGAARARPRVRTSARSPRRRRARRRRRSLDELLDGALGGGRGHGRAAARRSVTRRHAVRARRPRAPRVMLGRAVVMGALDKNIIRRVVRRHLNQVRYCYEREGTRVAGSGRVDIRFVVASTGRVRSATARNVSAGFQRVSRCVARALASWRFPAAKGGGIVVINYPFVFQRVQRRRVTRGGRVTVRTRRMLGATAGLSGKLAQVTKLLSQHRFGAALALARRWRSERPGDVLALVALGDALTHKGLRARAARAYGSIIDLFPSRADMRRFAGNRLSALGAKSAPALALARDTYAVAAKQRADHPNSHRLLAYAELRAGHHAKAFRVLEQALGRRYPGQRFLGVRQVMREDLGLVAAAWIAKSPGERKALLRRLGVVGATLASRPSMRFVMSWETDANDVDLHVYDRANNHAFYRHKSLGSGGNLRADVTTGYGPEAFVIEGRARAFPYTLQVHYYRRGPMGYGMGTVQVVQHDGRGGLRFREEPFVVMKDRAYVEVMTLKRRL